MPNYFITNTARYNPFTLNELASYAAQITDRENAFIDEFNNIDDGTLATYLANENPETSVYRKQYDDLMAKLQDASVKINNREYSPELFRTVKNIRGDYKKLSTPVEAGYKRMTSILSEYDKLARSGMPIGENPHDKDLSYFIENPNYAPQYRDAKQLIAMGAAAGEAAAIDFDPVYKLSPDGKYYNIQTRRTATPEEIKTDSTYRKSIDNLLKLQGFNPESQDSLTQQARSMLEFGMANSMSDKGLKQQVNPGYKTNNTTVPTDQTPKGWREIPGKDGLYKIEGTENQRVVIKRSEDGTVSYVTDEEEKASIIKSVMGDKPSSHKEDKLSGFTGMFTPSNKPDGGFVYKATQTWLDKDISASHRKKPIITIFDDATAREEFSNLKDTKGKYESGYYYGIREAGTMKSYIKINKSQYDKLKASFGDKFNDMSNSKSSSGANNENVESKPQKDEEKSLTVPPGIPAPATSVSR